MVRWKDNKFNRALAGHVPQRPGVYAIVGVRRVMGLLTDVDVLYVGRTKNLRRRFGQHTDPWRQHNDDITKIMARSQLEFWYLEVPEQELAQVEKQLIRKSNPRTNKILYGERK